MVTTEIAMELIRTLSLLPPDKVAEVKDFANFLKDRYAVVPTVEYSSVWTDEDIRDLTAAAFQHAEQTIWSEQERNG